MKEKTSWPSHPKVTPIAKKKPFGSFSSFDIDTDTDIAPEYAPKWPDEVKPVEYHTPDLPVFPPTADRVGYSAPMPPPPYPPPARMVPETPIEAPKPVKEGKTHTVYPDKAYDRAVAETVVRKNDPPK